MPPDAPELPLIPVDAAPVVPEAVPAVVEAASVAEAPALVSDTPSLLESATAEPVEPAAAEPVEDAKPDGEAPKEGAKPDDKPVDPEVEAKPDGEAAPVEVEKPALEPIDYKYELPETFKMDDAAKADVHSAFDAFRTDPTNPQPLIDLYASRMTAYDEKLRRDQQEAFKQTRAGWRNEVMADPVLGGAGYQTAMTKVAEVRDALISDAPIGSDKYKSDRAAFDAMCRITGVGDNPTFLRLLHNAHALVGEPRVPSMDIKPAPQPKSGARVLHDKTDYNKGRA